MAEAGDRSTGASDVLRDDPVDAEVLESDLVYSGRVWDVRNDTVRYGDGRIVRQYVAHRVRRRSSRSTKTDGCC